MLLFYLLSIPYTAVQVGNNIEIQYNIHSKDALIKNTRGMMLFYQLRGENDSTYSNYLRLRKGKGTINVPDIFKIILFRFEDKNGVSDPEPETPYIFILKKDNKDIKNGNIYVVRYYLNRRTPDYKKGLEFSKKEISLYPSNPWGYYYKWLCLEKTLEKSFLDTVKNDWKDIHFENAQDSLLLTIPYYLYTKGVEASISPYKSLVKNYSDWDETRIFYLILKHMDKEKVPAFIDSNLAWIQSPNIKGEIELSSINWRQPAKLEKWLEKYPNNKEAPMIAIMLGSMYASLDWDKAKTYFEIAISSNDPQALNSYAYTLAEKGDELKKAGMLIKKALNIVDERWINRKYWMLDKATRQSLKNKMLLNFYDTYGWILFKQKRYRPAEKYLKKAYGFMGEEKNPDILIHLAKTEESLNRKEKAIDTYIDVLSIDPKNDTALFHIKKLYKGKDIDSFIKNKIEEKRKKGRINKPAPDFTVELLKGGKITLSKLKGKVVELNFWATWCGPCIKEIPELNQLVKKMEGKPVVFLGITSEGDKIVNRFLSKQPFNYEICINGDEPARLYNITAIPTHIIIDRNGHIAYKHIGYTPGLADVIYDEMNILLEER